MNAFNFLTVNGKFNNSEIMKHAHVLKAYRRISLSEALKQAWFLAKREQKEYNEVQEDLANYTPSFPKKQGNVLKSFFLNSHPENVNYDSSWR